MQIPTAEQPTPPPQAVVRIEQGPGNAAQTLAIPMTRADVAAIPARRDELSNQLISASGRRSDLANELRRAIGAARLMWKRAAAGPVRNIIPAETAGRLERIEQAVEAIAVEVERVSEGQRFVTKLMSDAKSRPELENARMLPQTHSGRES